MKADAVAHCLRNGSFIRSRRGTLPIPDFYNPHLLTWLFPHLDPWGIGGFYDPRRSKKVSLSNQLQHMLKLADSLFEKDANFAFVYYNIMHKREVVETTNFRVKEGGHRTIVQALLDAQPQQLEDLARRFEKEPNATPMNETEVSLLTTLRKLSLVCKELPGTSAYKQCRRNEIRALIGWLGCPALFVTLNPSDVHHPLVRLLAGDAISLEDASVGEPLDKFHRKILVAKNPGAAALFFDSMVSNFIKIILGWKKESGVKGLFGKVTGYYGMVEAQGKGTLHCHMLIWLVGHLSPQALRDKMQENPEFQAHMFCWLESIIKCELPRHYSMSTDQVQAESRPQRANPHPSTLPLPLTPSRQFSEAVYNTTVETLAQELNWHEHTSTCWKYREPGEPHDDAHCRMRMDGSIRLRTETDPETHSILLRRLHPHISNYNDLITFLLKCNNDIKFIGSGEGAKALLYYVTDYITKSSLPTHVGLSALCYATQSGIQKYATHDQSSGRAKNLVSKCINAMMARQEISHQQVMSYLLGGGDYYTSHEFAVLYWGSFDHVFYSGSESHNDFQGPSSATEQSEGNHNSSGDLCLTIDQKNISASNQEMDYRFRNCEPAFDNLSLYEFVAYAKKITLKSENQRLINRATPMSQRGRPANTRGCFTIEHSQCETHTLRLRSQPVIPVILGPSFSRRDRSPEEYEHWCRAMLIVFKPWRTVSDLKGDSVNWSDAFSLHPFSAELVRIMHNLQVLHECKDARDQDRQTWESIAIESEENRESLVFHDQQTDEPSFHILGDELNNDGDEEGDDAAQALFALQMAGITFDSSGDVLNHCHPNVLCVTPDEKKLIVLQAKLMSELKKKKRPLVVENGEVSERQRIVLHHPTIQPATDITTMQLSSIGMQYRSITDDFVLGDTIIDELITSEGMTSNPEQAHALKIIGNHILRGTDQLIMYISGVGGTGKSHVINTVVKLFERLHRRKELLLSAPTGISAIVIKGYTIHALTGLPKTSQKVKLTDIQKLWCAVRYIIVDEISMVSALLLAQISQRISQVKGFAQSAQHCMFGNVNIIFTGDLAQLKPVKALAMFSHELVNDLRI